MKCLDMVDHHLGLWTAHDSGSHFHSAVTNEQLSQLYESGVNNTETLSRRTELAHGGLSYILPDG